MHRAHRRPVIRVLASAATLLLAAVMPGVGSASPAEAGPAVADPKSADLLLSNYSFESQLSGWTASCPQDVTTSTEQHYTGDTSAVVSGRGSCTGALESSYVDATPGESYIAYVRLFRGAATAAVSIRFWDATGHVLDEDTVSTASTPKRTWATVEARGTAPAGATRLSIRLAADAHAGDTYFDDALVTRQFTDLGEQRHNSYPWAVAFGQDADGRPVGYVIIDGTAGKDAHLGVVDISTGALTGYYNLPGAMGSWGVTVGTDNRAYIGGYDYSNGFGARLFRYTPGQSAVETLGGPIAHDTYIWDVAAGANGSVFGGDSPSGGIFEYSPATGFRMIGNRPLMADSQYVRSVGYDPVDDIVYAGLGMQKSHLMACDPSSGSCNDVLPAELQQPTDIHGVTTAGNTVFAFLEPQNAIAVLRVTKNADLSFSSTLVRTIENVQYHGVSPALDGKVYYIASDKEIWSYDIATDTTTDLGVNATTTPRQWGVVHMPDQATYPGDTVATIGTTPTGIGQRIVLYNPQTAKMTTTDTDVPGAAIDLETVQRGPDGKIYSAGYLGAGLAGYTPMRSDENFETTYVGQAEGQATLGDKLYLGAYPGALIYSYDPSHPIVKGSNPGVVCTLSDQGQDRPYGMTSGGGKLFIGTMAEYGQLTGALTVYDPSTGQCTVHKNIVPNESIVSLAYLDGKVYGGTLIWGGLGIGPSESEAKLLVYDAATGASSVVALPVRGLRALTGLTVGPDHRIWMTAEKYLFIYDPATRKFVYSHEAFPNLDYPTQPGSQYRLTAYDSFLTTGKDGNVYGTIHSAEFFRIDRHTKQVTVLEQGKVVGLTTDGFGNIYYIGNDNSHLERYAF